MHLISHPKQPALAGLAVLVAAAMALSGCGGGAADAGGTATASAQAPGAVATATTVLGVDVPALPDGVAEQSALPSFHIAPTVLDEPDDRDADGYAASATLAPRVRQVASHLRALSTRRLTLQALQERASQVALPSTTATAQSTPRPMVVTTFTPAQIRAAYALPALPASTAGLSAAQAAQLGAGQTIYIVDAQHDPNVAAELAVFNQKFGLPACANRSIAANAGLPLPAASTTGCELSVVYSNTAGAMTASAPAYDSGWATEITLDVQWTHATAPLARIVLIEAPDSSINSLLAAVSLANAMGPGVVSMSFGASEGSWTSSVDAAFAASGMTYLAATGDSGAGVSWPAVSTRVVAVGGTSLSYSGGAGRSETTWSGTGGGVSGYVATPSYQVSAVPGLGTPGHRSVADVSFNADPYTGQYVAVIAPGSSTASWLSAGGTSLSTPQWAGLVAVANAVRAQAAKPRLGAPHAVLYDQISVVPGTYAGTFADVTTGADGSCASCIAKAGYDTPTGLGTPNGANLVNTLAGVAVAPTAPVVTPAAISGTVGTALSFTVSVIAPNPVTFSLSGAPSGMAISAAGVVSWAKPVAGSYPVQVTAKDSKTGLTGSGAYSVTIAPPQPPGVPTGATITGRPGVALSFTVAVSSPDPVTLSLAGAPAGMVIGTTGVVSWPKPMAGTYKVVVTAKDTKTGLAGSGSYTVAITAAGPVITAAPMVGVAGRPLAATISLADAGASSLSISISGVPLGMGFSLNGLNVVANWPNPVTGSYALKVAVVDSAGLSATATIPVTITAK